MLRATRRHPTADQWVSVSGADPLNLVGILTPGPRLPALAGNRLLYRDGIPTAVLIADDIQFLEALDNAKEWIAQKELLRGPAQAPPLSPATRFTGVTDAAGHHGSKVRVLVRPPKFPRNSAGYNGEAKGSGRPSFYVRRMSENARPEARAAWGLAKKRACGPFLRRCGASRRGGTPTTGAAAGSSSLSANRTRRDGGNDVNAESARGISPRAAHRSGHVHYAGQCCRDRAVRRPRGAARADSSDRRPHAVPRERSAGTAAPRYFAASSRRSAGRSAGIFRSKFTGARATPTGCDPPPRRCWVRRRM